MVAAMDTEGTNAMLTARQTVESDASFLDDFAARRPVEFASMPGMQVHLFSVEKCLDRMDELATLLSPDENRRAEDISHAMRRSAYTASRVLLRATLTEATRGIVPPGAWAFGANAHGKPLVTSPVGVGMRFSLSYTSTLIAIAVSQKHELGVDIETIPSTISEVPWQVLTQAERQFIRALPPAEQFAEFLNIWTIKEAYTKYLGVGASLDFRKVEVTTSADLASARTDAGMHMPDPVVKQRTLAVGWQQIVLAVAGAKPIEGRYAAPAGESVALLRRV